MSITQKKLEDHSVGIEYTVAKTILNLHDHTIKIKLVCCVDENNFHSYRVINSQQNSVGEYDFMHDNYFSVPVGIENPQVTALCEKQLKDINAGLSAKFNMPKELLTPILVEQCNSTNKKNATEHYDYEVKKYLNAHFEVVHSLKEKITIQIDHLRHIFDHSDPIAKAKLK